MNAEVDEEAWQVPYSSTFWLRCPRARGKQASPGTSTFKSNAEPSCDGIAGCEKCDNGAKIDTDLVAMVRQKPSGRDHRGTWTLLLDV